MTILVIFFCLVNKEQLPNFYLTSCSIPSIFSRSNILSSVLKPKKTIENVKNVKNDNFRHLQLVWKVKKKHQIFIRCSILCIIWPLSWSFLVIFGHFRVQQHSLGNNNNNKKSSSVPEDEILLSKLFLCGKHIKDRASTWQFFCIFLYFQYFNFKTLKMKEKNGHFRHIFLSNSNLSQFFHWRKYTWSRTSENLSFFCISQISSKHPKMTKNDWKWSVFVIFYIFW